VTDVLPPTPEGIARAAGLVRDGELVAFPTDTVYGVGGGWEQGGVLDRIFALKRRLPEKRVPILVESLDQAASAGWWADERAAALAARFWPGPLTLVLARRSSAPLPADTQAFRAPDHPVALALLRAAGPLYATSANVSGEPETLEAVDVLVAFATAADALSAVIDGGRVPGGVASTVVDLSIAPARVVRDGPLSRAQLAEVIDITQEAEGAG
jgi:L-threonylcarbamoyladenylate synthase